MIGLAGSQGPCISFLYFCNPMSHQLQIPMARNVRMPPSTTPAIHAPLPPPVKVTETLPQALMMRAIVRARWPRRDIDRRCRRKMGNRPNTSMENSVSEKTCVVDGSRDASTVEAIKAELVDIDAGSLLSGQ
jgi:hypothetical protein